MSRAGSIRGLHRNVWAASGASFLTDVSSEMIHSLLPFFLANVLGVKTAVIGLVEGVAETTSSLVKLLAGRLSDRSGRKWLAVGGYALSTLAKPAFALAGTWTVVAGARWTERAGKGIRTAPRDALVADSVAADQRGVAFGFHRAADTLGALVGVGIAMAIVWHVQRGGLELGRATFATLVWVSLVPAALAVAVLALGARDVPRSQAADAGTDASDAVPAVSLRGLGRPFAVFLAIVSVFELGNSADAFLLLRAQERGLSLLEILAMLIGFNFVYAIVATPAGRLSDRLGRRPLIVTSWALYAAVYLGFARASSPWHTAALYGLYGAHYGLGYGTAKAFIADLVPASQRGTAYGAYHAVAGLLDLPASLLAGILWQGLGSFDGFGPAAPFWLGAGLSAAAAIALLLWRPPEGLAPGSRNAARGIAATASTYS